MNTFSAYKKGLQLAFGNKRMWLLLYALNFLFAFIVTLPVFSFLNKKLAKTLAIDHLADGFDFTYANDILNKYPNVIEMLGNHSIMITFLYLILSIFLVGGILNVFKVSGAEKSLSNFWSGCAKYFWRMFRLTFYFLIIHVVVFVLFFMLYGTLTAGGLDRFESEKDLWNIGYIVFGIYLFFATVFFMVHDYAKIHLVHNDPNWLFQTIPSAFKFVFRNFGKTLLLYLLNLITFGVFFLVDWLVNPSNILLAFLVGQFFIIGRIGTKLLNLGSANALFSDEI